MVGIWRHLHSASVGGLATCLGDGPGADIGRSVRRRMNHAGPGIQVLPLGSKGHAGKLAAGMLPVENAAWIQHGHMGAEGAGHPLNNAVLLHQGTLRVQVHHVPGPVLNGGVAEPCPLPHEQLHAACMKVGHVVFWRTAPLNKVQAGIFFQNNQRMLELPCPCRIQAEIGLQRNIHMHPFRHVDKGAT